MELKNLTIGYHKKVIASGLDVRLEAGKLTCLLGPNGAGKSTLLRTMACFQPALSGEVCLKGKNLADLLQPERARLISVVLTERVDIDSMTVRELVAMGRSPYTNFWGKLTSEDMAVVEEALERCGVTELADREASTLSDGERQKAMIAKALAQQTPVILLDEPTAFLDFPSKADTMLLLRQLAHAEQKTILISTHDLDIAMQTADRLWLMGGDGQLLDGTPSELASSGHLRRFFSNPNIKFDEDALRFSVSMA